MSSFNLSPNMSLPVPIPGSTPGPDFASDLNASLLIIDSHNHTPGSGVQITADGISITSDLPFNNNNATLMRTVRFASQSAALSGSSDVGCLYEVGNELYYNDGLGNQVPITSGGNVAVTSSGISGPPTASAAFVSSILTVIQSAGVGAAIDAATYILRYNGSYPSPSGNFISLQAPSSLSSGFALTFPDSLPPSTRIMTMAADGSIGNSYRTDGTTITVTSSVIGVATGGITTTQIAANAGITGGQIANLTLANINIAGTAAIEGEKLATNPNFLGKHPTSAGKNIVVANTNATNGLAIIRGYVSDPTTPTNGFSGEGVTPSRPGTGSYLLTFSTAFTDIPAVVVTVVDTGAAVTFIANITALSTTAVSIDIATGGVLTNKPFTFIIAGQRL